MPKMTDQETDWHAQFLLQKIEEDFPVDAPDWNAHDYAEVIYVLHEKKGLSFRKIVDYLGSQGVKTNRTTVYDIFKDFERDYYGEGSDPLIDYENMEIVEE